MEIKINKQYIHTKEDFINYIRDNNKELDVNKTNEDVIFDSFICIKNYIISNEL